VSRKHSFCSRNDATLVVKSPARELCCANVAFETKTQETPHFQGIQGIRITHHEQLCGHFAKAKGVGEKCRKIKGFKAAPFVMTEDVGCGMMESF
jgi:hypothetical protein